MKSYTPSERGPKLRLRRTTVATIRWYLTSVPAVVLMMVLAVSLAGFVAVPAFTSPGSLDPVYTAPAPVPSVSQTPKTSPTPTPTPSSSPTKTVTPSKTPSVKPSTTKPVKPSSKPSTKPNTCSGFTGKRTQVIKFKTTYRNDSGLQVGKTKTVRAGRNGVRTFTYSCGKVVSNKVTRNPVTKIVAKGTKPKTYTTRRTLVCSARVGSLTAYGYGTKVSTRISGPKTASGSTRARITNGPAGTYQITATATNAKVSVNYGFTGCK